MSEIPVAACSKQALRSVWLVPEEYPEWDSFVENHPLGLIYHSSSWKKTLEDSFKHIGGHFLALRSPDTGKIVAGIAVYSIRSWLLGNRICSIPFASISDPLISSVEHMQKLLPEIEKFRASNSYKDIEIRSVKSTDCLGSRPFITTHHFLHHYIEMDRPPDELYARLPAKAIKHEIKRALKNNIRVIEGADCSAVSGFYPIYAYTRKELGLPLIPIRFFESMAASVSADQFFISRAVLDNEVVAVMLTLKNGRVYHVEYTGNTVAGARLGAGKLLYWNAIKHAWQSGCSRISFGRTDISNLGLRQFKKRWGAIEEPISTSFIARKEGGMMRFKDSGMLAEPIKWLFRHSPSFLNKVLSSFIYSHHG